MSSDGTPAADRGAHTQPPRTGQGELELLVGSGGKIGLFAAPFVIAGVILEVLWPAGFAVGGPPPALRTVSVVVTTAGVVVWAWSVVLILRKVPRGELITSGPYAVVKHPLYTGVALLVLPWAGFLVNTWLGAALGLVLYLGSRLFVPEEEADLAERFGPAWEDYRTHVAISWL